MLCQICGKKQAVIFIQETGGGKSGSLGICVDCAKECAAAGGAMLKNPDLHNSFANLGDFSGGLASIIDSIEGMLVHGSEHVEQGLKKAGMDDIACPLCSWTFSEFVKTRSFGCPECCRAFSGKLEKFLLENNRACVHAGRIPDVSAPPPRQDAAIKTLFAERVEIENSINDMRRALDEAVRREEYEHAAFLRDRIAELEQKRGAAKK